MIMGKCGHLVKKVFFTQTNGTEIGYWYCEFDGVVSTKEKYISTFLEDYGVLERKGFVS